MIAHDIIDGNANGKCHSPINALSIRLFCIQFGRLCLQDGLTEFTDINDFGTWNTLGHYSHQGKVYNFGCLLVFRADITVVVEKDDIFSSNVVVSWVELLKIKKDVYTMTYLLERSVISSASASSTFSTSSILGTSSSAMIDTTCATN
jgi:hypothetical protein